MAKKKKKTKSKVEKKKETVSKKTTPKKDEKVKEEVKTTAKEKKTTTKEKKTTPKAKTTKTAKETKTTKETKEPRKTATTQLKKIKEKKDHSSFGEFFFGLILSGVLLGLVCVIVFLLLLDYTKNMDKRLQGVETFSAKFIALEDGLKNLNTDDFKNIASASKLATKLHEVTKMIKALKNKIESPKDFVTASDFQKLEKQVNQYKEEMKKHIVTRKIDTPQDLTKKITTEIEKTGKVFKEELKALKAELAKGKNTTKALDALQKREKALEMKVEQLEAKLKQKNENAKVTPSKTIIQKLIVLNRKLETNKKVFQQEITSLREQLAKVKESKKIIPTLPKIGLGNEIKKQFEALKKDFTYKSNKTRVRIAKNLQKLFELEKAMAEIKPEKELKKLTQKIQKLRATFIEKDFAIEKELVKVKKEITSLKTTQNFKNISQNLITMKNDFEKKAQSLQKEITNFKMLLDTIKSAQNIKVFAAKMNDFKLRLEKKVSAMDAVILSLHKKIDNVKFKDEIAKIKQSTLSRSDFYNAKQKIDQKIALLRKQLALKEQNIEQTISHSQKRVNAVQAKLVSLERTITNNQTFIDANMKKIKAFFENEIKKSSDGNKAKIEALKKEVLARIKTPVKTSKSTEVVALMKKIQAIQSKIKQYQAFSSGLKSEVGKLKNTESKNSAIMSKLDKSQKEIVKKLSKLVSIQNALKKYATKEEQALKLEEIEKIIGKKTKALEESIKKVAALKTQGSNGKVAPMTGAIKFQNLDKKLQKSIIKLEKESASKRKIHFGRVEVVSDGKKRTIRKKIIFDEPFEDTPIIWVAIPTNPKLSVIIQASTTQMCEIIVKARGWIKEGIYNVSWIAVGK